MNFCYHCGEAVEKHNDTEVETETCVSCKGTGYIQIFAFDIWMDHTCTDCDGRGYR